MLPSFYLDVYKKPLEQRFTAAELMGNTEFPYMNSTEYRQTPVERTLVINPVWEAVAINSQKHVVIGTNKCTGREWCSTLWGFENIKNINERSSAFRLQIKELVTKITYLTDNILLMAFRNGSVELWSTYTQVRKPEQPYCLFLIAKKYEHLGAIECLEPMEPRTKKAITGGKDFTLKIWDFGEEDLQSSHTFRYAHIDAITGISHLQTNDSIFATCSRDESVLLWDLRMPRPASALYLDHNCSFQECAWLDDSKPATNNVLVVGDAAGYIHAIDQRAAKKFLNSEKLFDQSIRKISRKDDNLAIIANTNIVKVYSSTEMKTIYENDAHTHFVRDCVWYDALKLLTVGCDGILRKHDL